MKLIENIQRIHSLMSENKDEMMKKMIDKHGFYHTFKLMGGYDSRLEKYISNENIIDFIKTVVTNLCDDADNTEIGGPDFGPNPIFYRETETQQHFIEYYRPEGVVIERYGLEDDDDEEYSIDNGDNYLGSYLKRYEDLSPSILTEILHLLMTQI
jgi:hypothetical protein